MGHQKWACLSLEALLENKHEIVGVVTETDDFDKKEQQNYERFKEYDFYGSLKDLAKEKGLQLFQPNDVNNPEFIKKIESLNPDLITIVSYHSIIKEELISKYKIINAHNSPLPKYRGRAPINWAIINGEEETGVTVHFVDNGIDSGDIITQEKVKIDLNDTAINVLKKCLPLYPKLISEAVKQIQESTLKPIKQNEDDATYFPRRTPKDGVIDWNQDTVSIYNNIRALTKPYPGAFTYHNGKKLYLWEASLPKDYKNIHSPLGLIFGRTEKGLKVSTLDNYLVLEKIGTNWDEEIDAIKYFKHLGVKLGIDPLDYIVEKKEGN